jgi:uncharacterized membrane protein
MGEMDCMYIEDWLYINVLPFSNLVDLAPPPPRTNVISQVSPVTITTIPVLNTTSDSITTIIEAPVIVVASFYLVITNTRT